MHLRISATGRGLDRAAGALQRREEIQVASAMHNSHWDEHPVAGPEGERARLQHAQK